MNLKRLEVFLEFLFFGVIVGIIEDIIAVKVTTGAKITFDVFWIIVLVAIPFAFLGEIVVDRINFVEIIEKFFKNNSKNKNQ